MHLKNLVTSLVCLISITLCAQDLQVKPGWYAFSEDGKECIIKNSALPTPWLNRLSNDVFSTWITHNGYIESYMLDPRLNGLTNPQDVSGHFYIRDKNSGNYFHVNKPVKGGIWESRVGLGYNILSQTADNISARITYFVPRNDNVLVMLVDVKNTGSADKEIELFSQVEWSLGDPVKSVVQRGDGRAGSQFNLYKKVDFDDNVFVATERTWKQTGTCRPWPFKGFFTVSEHAESFEATKDIFLGPEMNYNAPDALITGKLSETKFWSQSEYPISVLKNAVSLKPGEEKTFSYVLGMVRTEEDHNGLVKKYTSVSAAKASLQEVKKFYDNLLDQSVTIETPDKENDRIINIWSKYQWRQFFKRSQNNGAYIQGLWSYGLEGEGMGTGVEHALLPFDMSLIKSGIVDHFVHQISDTSQSALSVPQRTMLYKDLDIDGPNRTFKGEKDAVTHRHTITSFMYPIYFYLLESNDLKLLDSVVSYVDGKKGTVWEHIQTALTICNKVISKNGLPRVPAGHGDWMDEFTRMSEHSNAESVMLAGELGFILKGFIDIAKRTNHLEDAAKWQSYYDKMKKSINDRAWDGDWYVAAFSDRGDTLRPFGTKNDKECKIYLNSQSWAVLSGLAPVDRGKKAIASVDKLLSSDFGPMVFAPSFSSYVDFVGTQSIYAPGFRNACIYLRPVGWAIMASCLLKEPGLAYKMYENAALTKRAKDIERFVCEPYVYPELYNGPDHRLKGRGEFQWNLGEGTAWMWYSYVYYILGIRSEFDGLMVDPQIPAAWDGYKMKRSFRGNTYSIEVKNPRHVSNGVRSITVNGKKIKGNIISVNGVGKEYKVVVTM